MLIKFLKTYDKTNRQQMNWMNENTNNDGENNILRIVGIPKTKANKFVCLANI